MMQLIQTCYATASSSAELVNAIHDSFADNINNSYEFFFWLIGIGFSVFALLLILKGFKPLIRFFTKGRF